MAPMNAKNLKIYAATFAVMFVLDAIWLGLVARGLYSDMMGSLMASNPNWAAALAFYLVYPIGLVIFAVRPALEQGGAVRAALLGALFGFFAYGTYDMTNLAVVEGWPLALSFIDLAWGTCVSAVSAALGLMIARRWLRR